LTLKKKDQILKKPLDGYHNSRMSVQLDMQNIN
jgi:hypothetical protein